VGIDVEILDSLADHLVDGRHGVSIDGEPADGDVRSVLYIGLDGLGQGHDFIRSYIHDVSLEYGFLLRDLWAPSLPSEGFSALPGFLLGVMTGLVTAELLRKRRTMMAAFAQVADNNEIFIILGRIGPGGWEQIVHELIYTFCSTLRNMSLT
jgi:hypothetical protein